MTIAICGSMYHMEGMLASKQILEDMGHTVHIPNLTTSELSGKTISIEEKHVVMRDYLSRIQASDAIFVYNKEKHGIPGYIGANTLIEMSVAFVSQILIYLLEEVGDIPAKEEIEAMYPVVIQGNINTIV